MKPWLVCKHHHPLDEWYRFMWMLLHLYSSKRLNATPSALCKHQYWDIGNTQYARTEESVLRRYIGVATTVSMPHVCVWCAYASVRKSVLCVADDLWMEDAFVVGVRRTCDDGDRISWASLRNLLVRLFSISMFVVAVNFENDALRSEAAWMVSVSVHLQLAAILNICFCDMFGNRLRAAVGRRRIALIPNSKHIPSMWKVIQLKIGIKFSSFFSYNHRRYNESIYSHLVNVFTQIYPNK